MTSFMKSFAPLDWFEKLFGFKDNPSNVNKYMTCIDNPEGSVILSLANNKQFPVGKFSLRSVESYVNLETHGGGHLHIIHGHGLKSSKLYLVDILTSQNHADFQGATFQAASNFNCLEFIGSKQSAASGVNNYALDHTQGPYCAIASGPAVTYRNYFVPHDDGAIGQINQEVHLLSRVPLKVEHGYILINQEECQRLQCLNVDWSNLNNYQVGVHQNCPITLKRSHNGFSLTTKDQITHQVYCSALNFQKNVITNRFTQALAENILMAEYRATILAAWDNSEKFPIYKGSKKCFLTLLGGGVFRNPFEIICRAISSCKDIIEGSGLDVYVVCFDDFCFNKTYPYLNKTIRETSGSIIEA